MHQKKSRKILIYFFLFIIITSINNISLNSFKLDTVQKIEVSGLSENNNEALLKEIKNLDLKNIFFLNKKELDNLIASNSLIEKFKVIKKYPSTLNVKIEQTNFLAEINHGGKNYIIGSNGKLISNKFNNQKLPFIFGKPDMIEFLEFKDIVDKSNIPYEIIENFYFFPSKRWDLKFDNNILLKLPKNVTKKLLNDVYVFLESHNISKSKVIDVRVNNQIILNE